jgi:hypothetical protein
MAFLFAAMFMGFKAIWFLFFSSRLALRLVYLQDSLLTNPSMFTNFQHRLYGVTQRQDSTVEFFIKKIYLHLYLQYALEVAVLGC